MSPEAAVEFFKAAFEREEQGGFQRIGKIPDTQVWRFLHYYRGLQETDVEVLKLALAKRAAARFKPLPAEVRQNENEAAAVERLHKGLTRLAGFEFTSLKLLKMSVGVCRSESPRMKAQLNGFTMPPEVMARVERLSTCKAGDVRKLVKTALQSRFGLKPENQGGGVWLYRQPDGDRPLQVEIDYGGTWGQQLRYGVHLNVPPMGRQLRNVNFENILGIGLGDWDFITEAQADQNIALLAELIEETDRFVRAVASH